MKRPKAPKPSPAALTDAEYYGDQHTYVPHLLAAGGDISVQLREAIHDGWRSAYTLIFGKDFVDVLAAHHRNAIRWHWAARHRVNRPGPRLKQPRYFSDFPMWSRGHMKSTVARRIAVMDALIELYYGRAGYCLYFSGTDAKTEKHAISIDKLLHSEEVMRHAPSLAKVQRSEEGNRSLGWKATFFYTASGHVYHFGSLQTGMAGGNVDDIRPTMMIPDDIDDRKLSPAQAEKNFQLLTTEILPMGAQGTLVFWAQNLINRYSCMYRIYKGRERVLTDRRPSMPIPAIIGLVTEARTVRTPRGNIVQDIIVGGRPTWKYFDLKACQREINRFGLPAFYSECQHEVERDRDSLMMHNWNDQVHVISVSQFEAVYGQRTMPASWPKEWGNDWARTKTARHANVAAWRTVSNQSSPLPGHTFIFHPMSFKANAQVEDVAERVLSCVSPIAVATDDGKVRTWAELRRDELIRADALLHTRTMLERVEYERSVLAEVIPKYSEPILLANTVLGGVNSHEREDIRLIFNRVYGLKCAGINPGKFGGTEQLNREMQIDYDMPDPFRPDSKGFTRWHVVVPDDRTQAPVETDVVIDGKHRRVLVYPPSPAPETQRPDDLHDEDLFRHQMVNWRLADPKLTETGERIDDPLKMDDDFGNLMQMFAVAGQLANIGLTMEEEYEILLPETGRIKYREDGSIEMDQVKQQQVEAARFFTNLLLAEKYGDEAVDTALGREPDSVFSTDGDEWWA